MLAANTLTLAVLIPTANSSRLIRASVGAVSLAAKAINNNGSFLHGKQLEYLIKEVACDSSDAMAAISVAMEQKKIAAVIGPDCSLACESTAYLTAGRNTIQISYACNSPLLSDKAKYPTVSPSLAICGAHPRTLQYILYPFSRASLMFAVCANDLELYTLGSGHCQLHRVGEVEAACNRFNDRESVFSCGN